MALQKSAVNPRLDAEHEFLPLVGRFHAFGRELRPMRDKAHPRRNRPIGRGIQHDAHLAAERHLPRRFAGQKKSWGCTRLAILLVWHEKDNSL